MSERDQYPAGVPCWVETTQPDPDAAAAFYRDLFGWELTGPGPMHIPGDPPGRYFVARLGGADVAGVGSRPSCRGASAAWNTFVAVDDLDSAFERATAAGGTVVAPPFDAPPAGRMAMLADPSGAEFCLWEAGTRTGAQRVNEPRAWAMSQLATDDPERCAAFYGAAFGWTTESFGEITMFRLPGYEGGEPEQPVSREVVAVMAPNADAGLPPAWSVDFWVDDVDATVSRAGELGGTALAPASDTPAGRTAVVADPQGASFSVSRISV